MMDIKYSNHAEEELLRRKISKEIIGDIIKYPEQRIKFENDIFIYQSIIEFDNKKKYLVRVIANKKNPKTIITVYKTSKINKYRR
ncbi:MAG: DUF4258 domain-containing protein [Ignavibacteria bacterium]|nr:DUF4258 domain-containing protein [Ignavibacteria bacterium]